MANIKITDLDAYTNPDSTDVLPIVDVDADTTKRVTIADLMENAGAGTAALPGIAFDGDPNTGIYRPAADQIAFSTAGTQRLLIDDSGVVTVAGDLTVNGTTTTVNSTTVTVDDKNIELGSVGTPTDTTADGGGITLKGATDKTLNWVNSTDSWTSSEHVDLASGKEFKINGTSVLSSTTLGSGVTGSSLTSVGTITSGVWNGTALTSSAIGTGAITTAKIADDAVDADKLANTTVTAGSYTAADITVDAQGRITAAANGTLGTAEIADDAITTLKIANDAVTTAKIADDAVTADKLANTAVTAGSYTAADITVDAQGRITAASSSSGAVPDKIEEGNSKVEVTDTGTDGTITLTTEGTARATLTSNGRFLINDTSLTGDGISANSRCVINGSTQATSQGGILSLSNNAAAIGSIFNGHQIGQIFFKSKLGEEFGLIKVEADGADAADGDSPGRMVFSTTADGASTPTERMRIDSSGNITVDTNTFFVDAVNNRVGVGTTSPAGNLHISGSGDRSLLITGGTAGTTSVQMGDSDDADAGAILYDNSNNSMQFKTNGSERMRIESSGRVGIGTSSPLQDLHVLGTAGVRIQNATDTDGQFILTYTSNSPDFRMYDTSGNVTTKLLASGNSYFTGGNVGIGTTSPTNDLSFGANYAQITSDTSDGSDNKAVAIGGGGSTGTTRGAYAEFYGNEHSSLPGYCIITSGNVASTPLILQSRAAHVEFRTGGSTEKARIDSSGRLLVGTSSSIPVELADAGFQVAGSDSEKARIHLVRTGANPAYLNISAGSSGNNVSNGTILGRVNFAGYHTDGYDLAARIDCTVDGTPGNGDMPGRLSFWTSADSSASPTERMRINQGGHCQLLITSNTQSRHYSIRNTSGTIGWTFGNGVTASARQFVVYDNEAGAARTVIDSSGNFKFNSGYGSAQTAYGCRAWVNFNGTGTVAVRQHGNVSSITDNGTGDYTVNFSTSMPDANYCVTVASRRSEVPNPGDVNVSADIQSGSGITPLQSGSVRVCMGDPKNVNAKDSDTVCVAIFR